MEFKTYNWKAETEAYTWNKLSFKNNKQLKNEKKTK